jgi:hypothetical protein
MDVFSFREQDGFTSALDGTKFWRWFMKPAKLMAPPMRTMLPPLASAQLRTSGRVFEEILLAYLQ